MNDRLILAIDTSFGPVSAALATPQGRILACVEADNLAGQQAETLPPLVEQMFASAALSFKQIACVAVTVGPGAFTGVRVGLAFAKGLRLATGASILGVTTLECLAAQAAREAPGQRIGVAIDAKRDEIYTQAFESDLSPLTEPSALPLDVTVAIFDQKLVKPFVLTGSGAALVATRLASESRIVAATRIDTKLLALRAIGADPQRYPATPAYLRAPDARLPS